MSKQRFNKFFCIIPNSNIDLLLKFLSADNIKNYGYSYHHGFVLFENDFVEPYFNLFIEYKYSRDYLSVYAELKDFFGYICQLEECNG